MLSRLMTRLRALLFRASHEAELTEEMRYHLDHETERNMESGMSPAEARTAARKSFGHLASHQEDVRDGWSWRWVEELRQDIGFGIRSFRRTPLLVLTVLLTIGLGLGINAAVFTLFNAYVLHPAPVRDPQSLYLIRWNSTAQAGHRFTWNQYRELTDRAPAIDEALGYRWIYSRVERRTTMGQLVTGTISRCSASTPPWVACSGRRTARRRARLFPPVHPDRVAGSG